MRVLMKGREREVTQKVGQALILLGKATVVKPAAEPKTEVEKQTRTYKRRDVVAETEKAEVVMDWPKPEQ